MKEVARESTTDRIEESVRHALRIVGPGERGIERVGDEEKPKRPAAA
jgi:hypothetical protein